jgi:acetyltransferase
MFSAITVRRRSDQPGPSPIRLADRARVIVRPIRAQDAPEFARAYTRLSDQSRWRRFLTVADQLPPADLVYLTSVDQRDHVALVAACPESGEIVGSARYFRLPGRPGDAELAVEVIDEWQRRGVGRGLLEALGAHARANGLERFTAIVAADNVPMQRALRRAAVTTHATGGEIEYLLDVGALVGPASASARRSTPCGGRSTGASRIAAARVGVVGPAPSPA